MKLVTLNSILEDVVKQIPVLLHGKREPSVLEGLVRDSVNKYQDRAGFSSTIRIEDDINLAEGTILPPDWLSLLSAMDSRSVYIETTIKDVVNEGGETEKRIFVSDAYRKL